MLRAKHVGFALSTLLMLSACAAEVDDDRDFELEDTEAALVESGKRLEGTPLPARTGRLEGTPLPARTGGLEGTPLPASPLFESEPISRLAPPPVPPCGGTRIYRAWQCAKFPNGQWGWKLVDVASAQRSCGVSGTIPHYTGQYDCIDDQLFPCGGTDPEFCTDPNPECNQISPPGPDSLCVPTRVPPPAWW